MNLAMMSLLPKILNLHLSNFLVQHLHLILSLTLNHHHLNLNLTLNHHLKIPCLEDPDTLSSSEFLIGHVHGGGGAPPAESEESPASPAESPDVPLESFDNDDEDELPPPESFSDHLPLLF